jgi:hypothetical protein
MTFMFLNTEAHRKKGNKHKGHECGVRTRARPVAGTYLENRR